MELADDAVVGVEERGAGRSRLGRAGLPADDAQVRASRVGVAQVGLHVHRRCKAYFFHVATGVVDSHDGAGRRALRVPPGVVHAKGRRDRLDDLGEAVVRLRRILLAANAKATSNNFQNQTTHQHEPNTGNINTPGGVISHAGVSAQVNLFPLVKGTKRK